MNIFNNKTEKIVFISKPAEYGTNSCFSLPKDIPKDTIDKNSVYMITVERISNLSISKRKTCITF